MVEGVDRGPRRYGYPWTPYSTLADYSSSSSSRYGARGGFSFWDSGPLNWWGELGGPPAANSLRSSEFAAAAGSPVGPPRGARAALQYRLRPLGSSSSSSSSRASSVGLLRIFVAAAAVSLLVMLGWRALERLGAPQGPSFLLDRQGLQQLQDNLEDAAAALEADWEASSAAVRAAFVKLYMPPFPQQGPPGGPPGGAPGG
ncbi:hypothetical protein ENH_00009960, partial [Eimeria necatrix]